MAYEPPRELLTHGSQPDVVCQYRRVWFRSASARHDIRYVVVNPSRITQPNRPSHRRRAVGMKRLDRLQPPGLALLALFLGPHDRLPVGRQDEARAGVGDLDAVAAGLVDVEEEGLLDRVLVRAKTASLEIDA
jgi:hypothetical protein